MTGYVYLIGSRTFGWYKIGKSKTPQTRIQDVGILLPFKIGIVGVWKTERHTWLESHLHEKYTDNRINGEWFHFTREEEESVIRYLTDYLSESARLPISEQFSNIDQDVLISGKIKRKHPSHRVHQLVTMLRKPNLERKRRDGIFQALLSKVYEIQTS